MIAILDTGPLYATIDERDKNHDLCRLLLERPEIQFVIPTLVAAETSLLIERRRGPQYEARFLRTLSSVELEPPSRTDWDKIATLVERYADFPLGVIDASVAVLAERLGTEVIITLDRRHFGVVRMSNGRPFRILPE